MYTYIYTHVCTHICTYKHAHVWCSPILRMEPRDVALQPRHATYCGFLYQPWNNNNTVFCFNVRLFQRWNRNPQYFAGSLVFHRWLATRWPCAYQRIVAKAFLARAGRAWASRRSGETRRAQREKLSALDVLPPRILNLLMLPEPEDGAPRCRSPTSACRSRGRWPRAAARCMDPAVRAATRGPPKMGGSYGRLERPTYIHTCLKIAV